MYFDIHSHILPDVDDGAKDIDEALELLKLSKKSGISAVIATPHFYPGEVNLEKFIKTTRKAFEDLKGKISLKKHPEIYLGCEILYYKGMSYWEELDSLTLGNSKYLLIELCDFDIKSSFFTDLLKLKDKGYEPIIAHIERYRKFKGFRKLLNFVKENDIKIQINAASVLNPYYKRTIKKIVKSELFCVLGTDAHSVDIRPPLMKEALAIIKDNYGKESRARFVKNSAVLYSEIVGGTIEK